MRRFPTQGEEAKPDSSIQTIMEDAIGPILALDAAPTTAGNQLPHHADIGYFSTDLYVRLGATIYRISLTAV